MEIGPQGVTYAREKSLVTTDLVHMLRVSGAKPLFTVHYTSRRVKKEYFTFTCTLTLKYINRQRLLKTGHRNV